MIKTLGKLRIERNFLIFTKDIYGKPTANSILNVERMNFFFFTDVRNKAGRFTLTIPIQHFTIGPSQCKKERTIKQKK